jgi:uridine kinase
MDTFNQFISAILARRRELPAQRAVLVGVGGIDASGKGFLTAKTVARLRMAGVNAATIGVDGWLNLPHIRFHPSDPAEHFYTHALRFDEMFESLILPLRDQRSLSLDMDYVEETATAYRKHRYEFSDTEVAIVEGIFLFKRAYRRHFDLACWVDCTFETSLERAIERGQEGLSPAATVRAFETIYFPAQRLHFARDDPRAAADLTIINDYRLADRRGVVDAHVSDEMTFS